MVFGVSMNTGEDADSSGGPYPYPWDPANARAILQWTIDAGYDDLLFGLELGNEQNNKYSAAQTAHNFGVLHNLSVELWPDASRRPVLFGPDPHSFHDGSGSAFEKGARWITDFLAATANAGLPIYAATHHEYIEVDDGSFTSPATLALSGQIASALNKTVRESGSAVRIFGGEIGPHNGGSPPCDHSSLRWAVFGDSLWYADNLAAKAKFGYSGSCRQDYIGADYGLVDCSTGAPLPDFWTGLVWATTMGPGVLSASVAGGGDGNGTVRVYAHCTARGEVADVPAGAVTALVINLGARSTRATFGSEVTRRYVLTPSVQAGSSLSPHTGLLGTGIELNGALLRLSAAGAVPTIAGEPVGADRATVPPTSVAFFVLAKAGHPGCK
jgi:heparanase 1